MDRLRTIRDGAEVTSLPQGIATSPSFSESGGRIIAEMDLAGMSFLDSEADIRVQAGPLVIWIEPNRPYL
jgi:hypothetical protein